VADTDATVYVGSVAGTDALVALVVEGTRVTAYTCGGEDGWQALTAWLDGELLEGRRVALGDGWGLELTGELADGAWSGTLVVQHRRFAWQATPVPADHPAGLYRLASTTREAGLIVAHDLTTAGVYYGTTSGKTAPIRLEADLDAGDGRTEELMVVTDAYGGTSSYTLTRTELTFTPPPTSPERTLRHAIARAFPDLQTYRLVTLDDRPAIATLTALARATAADPSLGAEPTHVTLPIVDLDGSVRDHAWTVYHHDVRGDEPRLVLVDLHGGPDVPLPEPGLEGPSLTFQGLPNLDAASFRALLDEISRDPGAAQRSLGDERRYQASDLSIVAGELSGRYAGDAVAYPSVLEGLGALLRPQYPATQVDALLADVPANYLLYSAAHFTPDLRDDDVHPHAVHAPPVTPAAGTSSVLGDPGQSELLVTPIFDATIYRADLPDDEKWLVPEAYAYVEAAVNRQNGVWGYFSLHLDEAADDWSDSSFSIRTRIHTFAVLSATSIASLDPANPAHYPEARCREAGSFYRIVTALFKGKFEDDNMYKSLWTTAYGGGCGGRGSLNGANGIGREYTMTWVGMQAWTPDWVKVVYLHEAAHVMDGGHDVDNEGDGGETTHAHRCRLLGVLELGHLGPSLLSYNGDVTRTLCLAYPTETGTPLKNLTIVAAFLREHLR